MIPSDPDDPKIEEGTEPEAKDIQRGRLPILLPIKMFA